ncbi:hypothetical protein OUZ56_025361 [Daphnia magna]|uniref:Chromo domain-containing protein n=1 Tax=Daphnia magna TaxID=35525 RepID=A0ABQ9ZJR2_9CRUS|nr:hypothetical protein OUZ56_025361 [Daphnia magna]
MAGNIDPEFEVEEILDSRKFVCDDGKLRVWYFVKFKNCPDSDNQWLPASFCNCHALVRQYYRNKKERELGTNEDAVAPMSTEGPYGKYLP